MHTVPCGGKAAWAGATFWADKATESNRITGTNSDKDRLFNLVKSSKFGRPEAVNIRLFNIR
jgi:hypothetical protein